MNQMNGPEFENAKVLKITKQQAGFLFFQGL